MHPILFKIGFFTIYSYGTALAVAFVVCMVLIRKESRRYGFDDTVITDICFWSLVGGIVGARMLYCLLNLKYYLENPLEIIMIQHGGLVWYGGFIAGTITAVLYLRKKRYGVLKAMDFLAPYIALGQAIGRIGCFLNGCCFGKPSDSCGIYFPVHQERLIPTQLYSSAILVLIFIIVRSLRTRPHRDGEVFSWYVLLYATGRFCIEFLRGDSSTVVIGLTVFQLISIALIPISTYAIIYLRRSSRR